MGIRVLYRRDGGKLLLQPFENSELTVFRLTT